MLFSHFLFKSWVCNVLISNQAQTFKLNMQNLQSLSTISFPLDSIFPSSKRSPYPHTTAWFPAPFSNHSQSTSSKQSRCPTARCLPATVVHCQSFSLDSNHLNVWHTEPCPLIFPLFLHQRKQEPVTQARFPPSLFPMDLPVRSVLQSIHINP